MIGLLIRNHMVACGRYSPGERNAPTPTPVASAEEYAVMRRWPGAPRDVESVTWAQSPEAAAKDLHVVKVLGKVPKPWHK